MNPKQYFDNPDFRAYVELLGRLHVLIRDNRDETPEGDELRDRMDVPGGKLDDEEIAEVSAIAGDFYQFSRPELWESKPPPTIVKKELEEAFFAWHTNRQLDALRILRKRRVYLEPHLIAYTRGRIWNMLGFHGVSLQYFDLCRRLQPNNSNYEFVWLDQLRHAEPEHAKAVAEEIVANPDSHFAKQVIKAADILVGVYESHTDEIALIHLTALIAIIEGALQRVWFHDGANDINSDLQTLAYALLAICHRRTGDFPAARKEYSHAIALNPGLSSLFVARGLTTIEFDEAQATKDFEQAVKLPNPPALAYMYLARARYNQGVFEESIALSRKALESGLPDQLQPVIYQWIQLSNEQLEMPANESGSRVLTLPNFDFTASHGLLESMRMAA